METINVEMAFKLGKLLAISGQHINVDQATSDLPNFALQLGKLASKINPDDIMSRVANETVADLLTSLPEQFWKLYFLGYIRKYVSEDTFILLERCVTGADLVYKYWQYAVARIIVLLCKDCKDSDSQSAQLELVRSSFKEECSDSIKVNSWFKKFKKLPSAAYENFLNCTTELGALCALAEGLSNVGESIDLFD